MKKILVLILSLAMVLSFAACGSQMGETETENPIDGLTPSGLSIGEIDFGGMFSGGSGSGIIWANADSDYKAEMKRQAEEAGVSVTFGLDGSTTFTDEGGTYIQRADGTWSFRSADGSEGMELGGGDWPDNEFTKVVPKPNMKVQSTVKEDSEVSIFFASDTSLEAVKAYAGQLKAKGFTIDAETYDTANFGMMTYTYTASNSAGYTVDLVYTGMAGVATVALSVSKD